MSALALGEIMTVSALLNTLKELSVLHAPPDKPFLLKSGGTSLHYVDVRRTALTGKGLHLIGAMFYDMLNQMALDPKRVAGVALGGCPLATAVSLHSYNTWTQTTAPYTHIIETLYVRPEAKGHGTGKLIEGIFEKGDSVVICEDVVTSGSSTLKAIEVLKEAELKVIGVMAVLDREEGGKEKIEAVCPFRSFTTLKELLG